MQFYIVKKIPQLLNLRIDRPNQAPVIIAGAGFLDRSHLQELVAKINEREGTKFSEADIEQQIEERIKGIYRKKPSFRQMQRDKEAYSRIMETKL